MKVLVLFFLFSSFQMKVQKQDSLIQLYNGMGHIIVFIDKEML